MKFHVWCPDRDEDESCACNVECNSDSSYQAASYAAERHYWNAADPFDEITLHVRPEGSLRVLRFVVEVVVRPEFEASFHGEVPG